MQLRQSQPRAEAYTHLGWLQGWKMLYLVAVVLAVWVWNDLDVERFHGVSVQWPREGEPVFASHFATWDAAHYLSLSEVGYVQGAPSCAFYPLWPLLIRWFSLATAKNCLLAGLLLANGLSLASWVILYRLVRERWGRRVASLSLLLLLAYPGALFFQFIYSESLFFLLLMVLWLSLERRYYVWAWGAAFLLPITRAVGLFCLFPIVWHLMTTGRHEPVMNLMNRARRLTESGSPTTLDRLGGLAEDLAIRPRRGRAWWLLLAPIAGWGCYLALMWHWTGNAFEGFEAQKHWAVHSIGNLWNLPKFVFGLFGPTQWHAFSGSLLDRSAFILLLYTLPLIWRMDKGMFVWACVLGVVPAMSGTFVSFTRFASCAFPMFIALAVYLAPRERRWLRWTFLAVFGTLHAVLVWRFVNFRWAG